MNFVGLFFCEFIRFDFFDFECRYGDYEVIFVEVGGLVDGRVNDFGIDISDVI